jgi:hypothetical protein
MLDRALDAIAARVGPYDREHDIPYLAGYSLDGKTIYIDRHLPRSFLYRAARSKSTAISCCMRRWKRR